MIFPKLGPWTVPRGASPTSAARAQWRARDAHGREIYQTRVLMYMCTTRPRLGTMLPLRVQDKGEHHTIVVQLLHNPTVPQNRAVAH